MRMTFRNTAFVTTAIIGLTAMSVVAAPPGATDPTATGTPPASSGAPPATSEPTANAASPTAGPQSQQDANGTADTAQGMEARVEQRINDLHAKLQITPAQEADWKKFAQTMRDNARKMDQQFEGLMQQLDSMNALENMRSYAKISQQHAQDVQALVSPFQALYGKMSQSQKQTADQVFREDANRGQPSQAQHG